MGIFGTVIIGNTIPKNFLLKYMQIFNKSVDLYSISIFTFK